MAPPLLQSQNIEKYLATVDRLICLAETSAQSQRRAYFHLRADLVYLDIIPSKAGTALATQATFEIRTI